MTTSAGGAEHNVFVYGSLQTDDVLRVLLNRVPQTASATLSDFHRFRIKGLNPPAILPVESKKVDGMVLLGITDPELHILDGFEGASYDRKTVEVSLMDRPEKLQVHTYVWSNKEDPNLYGEWDFEEWRQKHMEDFVSLIKEFAKEQELPEPRTFLEIYESFYQRKAENPPRS